jgi:hypothetical protein
LACIEDLNWLVLDRWLYQRKSFCSLTCSKKRKAPIAWDPPGHQGEAGAKILVMDFHAISSPRAGGNHTGGVQHTLANQFVGVGPNNDQILWLAIFFFCIA